MDLPAVAAIAVDAWRHAYSDLIGSAAVERYLQTAYSPSGLRNRISDHPIYVAADGPSVMAFADVFVEDGCVVISELCTVPRWRRHGFATRLIERAGQLAESLPVTADVVLGNVAAEGFYEHQGSCLQALHARAREAGFSLLPAYHPSVGAHRRPQRVSSAFSHHLVQSPNGPPRLLRSVAGRRVPRDWTSLPPLLMASK